MGNGEKAFAVIESKEVFKIKSLQEAYKDKENFMLLMFILNKQKKYYHEIVTLTSKTWSIEWEKK